MRIKGAHVVNVFAQPVRQVERGQVEIDARTVEPRIGQQLLNQTLQLADIAIDGGRFARGEIIAHLQPVAQAHQRRAQLVGDAVDQLLFARYQRIDIFRHLVKGDPQAEQAGGVVEMGAHIQLAATEALRRNLQALHLFPVRPHPDKHRQRQRHADKH